MKLMLISYKLKAMNKALKIMVIALEGQLKRILL